MVKPFLNRNNESNTGNNNGKKNNGANRIMMLIEAINSSVSYRYCRPQILLMLW